MPSVNSETELGSSVDYEIELEPAMRQIVQTMEKFEKEWAKTLKFHYSCYLLSSAVLMDDNHFLDLKQFQEISSRLSSLLPNVPYAGLSDIDDILMPNINQPHYSNTLFPVNYSGNSMSKLIRKCFDMYWNIIMVEKILDPTCMSAFIKLIPLLGNPSLDYSIVDAFINVPKCFKMQKITDICFALKLMRVVYEKCKHIIGRFMGRPLMAGSKRDLFTNHIPWLMKLIKFYKTKSLSTESTGKVRTYTWISRQSSLVLDYSVYRKDFIPLDLKFFSSKDDPELYVCNLILRENGLVQMDYLYSYFASSSDENERMQRIEFFVKGCVKAATEPETIRPYGVLHSFTPASWDDGFKFLKYFQYFVTAFHNLFWWYAMYESHLENWDEIEKYCGNRPESYLTDCKKSINDESLENVTTFCYTFYDEFINHLRLMRILHKAFWMAPDILEIERFPESYETIVFRSSETSYWSRNFRGFFFLRENFPKNLKWFEVTLKTCPFLYLSKHHEHLAGDLLKWANKVEEVSFDELFFALHGLPKYFSWNNSD